MNGGMVGWLVGRSMDRWVAGWLAGLRMDGWVGGWINGSHRKPLIMM